MVINILKLKDFQPLKEMYKNIDAARTLGISNAIINRKVKKKRC